VGIRIRTLVVLGFVAQSIAACGPSPEEKAAQAAVDSMAAARARGETDLSNPEMGSKMIVKLNANKLEQTHTSLPKGQMTIAVENHDKQSHIFEFKGKSGDWKSMPIPAGGYVLMSMILDAGTYDMFCPDSTKANNGCGTGKFLAK
jgi:hypothetical protein